MLDCWNVGAEQGPVVIDSLEHLAVNERCREQIAIRRINIAQAWIRNPFHRERIF